jgi:hypothetical protein
VGMISPLETSTTTSTAETPSTDSQAMRGSIGKAFGTNPEPSYRNRCSRPSAAFPGKTCCFTVSRTEFRELE